MCFCIMRFVFVLLCLCFCAHSPVGNTLIKYAVRCSKWNSQLFWQIFNERHTIFIFILFNVKFEWISCKRQCWIRNVPGQWCIYSLYFGSPSMLPWNRMSMTRHDTHNAHCTNVSIIVHAYECYVTPIADPNPPLNPRIISIWIWFTIRIN